MKKSTQENIEKAWSNVPKRLPRTRWWESLAIKQHIAKKVCSFSPEDGNWGLQKLKETNKCFKSAISVGGGSGGKEMQLLETGIVEHFDLYELSQERIQAGQKIAKSKGLENQITFHYGDFFASPHNKPKNYDLVFWSGSLHHMLNTKYAILTSYDILKDDGYFYCDEYVGKNRFQFSDKEIGIVNSILPRLPASVFQVPNSSRQYRRYTQRTPLEVMIEADISEAADSENIIPTIEKIFPHANIIHLGGLIYHLALSDILTNIPEKSGLLQNLLNLDDDTIAHNFYHYAFTLTPKHP